MLGLGHLVFKGATTPKVSTLVEWNCVVNSSVPIWRTRLNTRQSRAGARALSRQGKQMSNRTGMWSENTATQMSKLSIDKTRSNVYPCSCVEDVHKSIRSKTSLASGLSGQHAWISKSPTIKIQSYLGIISAKRSKKSSKNPSSYLDGR